ncbi:hypothetical protein GWK47_046738 [Chionoecetes opilio]|uniref:Uncharacterized protein n=1 Tax=Chionoecetes opilio TaxID=41210 RepID=A0A8J4YCQ8_CHIOP|nr:hypothetical protein GWK47_046738 [Chionoecetes opilio]
MEPGRVLSTNFILVGLLSAYAYRTRTFLLYSPLILDSSFDFVLPVEEDGNKIVRQRDSESSSGRGRGSLPRHGLLAIDNSIIRVCFEPSSETTLFTEHVIHGANIAAKDIDTSRPSFRTSSGFFSISMIKAYSQSSQLVLMTNLLGDEVSIGGGGQIK